MSSYTDASSSSNLPTPVSSSYNLNSDVSPPLSEAIDLDTHTKMKKMVFGNTRADFSDAWAQQGFFFVDDPDMSYGLKQTLGGSCGLLAVVQPYVVKDLIITNLPSQGRGSAA